MKRFVWIAVILVFTNRGLASGAQCGNGVLETGEQCDPPGSTCLIFSTDVQICTSQCVCIAVTATASSTPRPPTATPTTTATKTKTSTPTPTPTGTPTGPPLSLSINDVGGPEGAKFRLFVVTLSRASTQQVSVHFSTVDGSAHQVTDYRATSGTLTFSPGELSKNIVVLIINGTLPEPTETFTVVLSSPDGAAIAKGTGIGTIVDDDGVGIAVLTPAMSSVRPGGTRSLTLTWTTPGNWHDLKTLDFRLEGDEGVVLWVRFDEADNTLAVCGDDQTCGAAEPPGGGGELQGDSATLFVSESRVKGSGPTGPSVDLTYVFSVDADLVGQTLRVEAAATNDAGDSADFAQVGELAVTSSSTTNDGCSMTAASEPSRTSVWLLVAPLLLVTLRRRAVPVRGADSIPAREV